jgi:hypothetical protein
MVDILNERFRSAQAQSLAEPIAVTLIGIERIVFTRMLKFIIDRKWEEIVERAQMTIPAARESNQ